jgi:hypothetical protein
MPPQQRDRLLDLLDDGFDLGAHDNVPAGDLVAQALKRNAYQ